MKGGEDKLETTLAWVLRRLEQNEKEEKNEHTKIK